jgi:hypothetical protein
MQAVLSCLRIGALVLAVAGLTACHGAAANSTDSTMWPFDAGDQHGRYIGVGIYTPSQEWTRLITSGGQASSVSARLTDDQAIIVTSDSRTGELRACGDLSGYCVGFNPWKQPLPGLQEAPVPLTNHVGDDAASSNTAAANKDSR